jgi:hypothetical protein
MTKTEDIENLDTPEETQSENLEAAQETQIETAEVVSEEAQSDARDVSEQTQTEFADQCIDLLCKQEKTLWLLGERDEKANNDESLALTWQMLIQFLDFAEHHFDTEEFGAIAESLHNVHEHTAEHKHKLNTRAWRLVRSLVGLESPDESTMNESYRELGDDYMDLFQTFFSVCANRFVDDSPARERFDQSVDVFLNELQEKW